MNWQNTFEEFANPQLNATVHSFVAASDTNLQQLSHNQFDDVDPQSLLRFETVLVQYTQYFQNIDRNRARRKVRQRQLRQRQDKRQEMELQQLQEKAKIRAQMKKPEPPSLYERMAAFIRSFVQETKPQLPKGMYSVGNVQKEREMRKKPLKTSYFIRSKKPTEPNRNA